MLRRWTRWHEEWQEEVGSVAVETPDGLVVIDPIGEPPAELGRPDHVLLTVFWHARDAEALGAPRVWASAHAARPLANRGISVTDSVDDGPLPGGIEAFPTARRGEVVYLLPEHRALVVGDVLLGAGAKPHATDERLRLCPERWLGARTHADLRESLRPLLELEIEQVLVSHGAPVLADGRRVLGKLIGDA
jgi:glyoxylase-like metal-dependent hydrolase (beta-lactamase superfamily II)